MREVAVSGCGIPATAQISATGTLKVKPALSASAAMHVLVDVVGYFQ